jgi:hypothetical protein
LDYLSLLMDRNFAMHLPGTPAEPWTPSWLNLRNRLIHMLSRMMPRPERTEAGGIPLLRLDGGSDEWVAIVHPLWSWDHLVQTNGDLASFVDSHRVEPISTFDLSRRPAGALDMARKRLAG